MKPVIVPFFISHQGCSHRCVFCDQAALNGSAGMLPATDEIAGTIRQYRETARRKQVEVAFYGGTFTSLPRSAQLTLLGAVQPFIRSGEVSGIRISTRPDAVDAAGAGFLAAMGVTLVELGAQSLDDDVLFRSGRGYCSSDIVAAVCTLRQNGLRVGIQLMQGLPGDTPERSLRSCDAALSLQPACLRLYPTVVLRGTQLADRYAAGEYQPLPLEEAVTLCKQMLISALRCGIPVIRMGIQPTDDLQKGAAIVAGPYHPAFRQLVESEICYDALARLVGDVGSDGPVVINCAPQSVSSVVGQRRHNIERLQNRFGVRISAIRQSPAFHRHELQVESPGYSCRINMVKDINACRIESIT